jgi:hypothetical protein
MDPITIGLAFTAAQSAVSHIKQAIALGKDIHSLVGQFSQFFASADAVHTASIKAKINNIGKSDAELSRQALEFAMHSNKLREDERALKDMIYWQMGKPQIWEDMIAERTRLIKLRQAEEQRIADAKQRDREKMGEIFMVTMWCIAGSAIMFAIVMGGVGIYGQMEEQRIYQEKLAANQRIRRERAQAEQQRQTKEALAAIK